MRAAVKRAGARLPIRWRLALMSFGLLAVLLAGLGTMVTLSEEHTLLSNQAAALRREARLAGGGLRPSGLELARPGNTIPLPAVKAPSTDLDPVIFVIGRLTGGSTRAALYTPDGSLLAGTPALATDTSFLPAVATVPASLVRQAVTHASADDAYTIVTDTSGARQLAVLIPIEDVSQQTTIGVLEVTTPTAPIDAAVTTTRLVLALGIAAALGLAAAIVFPLMSAGLRPLVAMEEASERIAAGALSLRLEEPTTNDEIGRLARSFNSMVAQLEAAFTRQKQFVADVSHELRTPLTALGGGLEMLMLGADRGDADAARRLTRGMYREVERMRRLVEDLLTLTRLDEGRTHLRSEPVAIAPLLSEVAEQAERLAPDRDIRTDVAAAMPLVRGDADRMRQVLLILLDNAVKYTPAGGSVTLEAHAQAPGQVELIVRDTGVGIPEEDLPHIFERFYRVDRSRARNPQQSGGAGLGLAIAKGLVEAQHGEIEIASTVGAGTMITLRFPAADKTTAPTVHPARIAPAVHGPTSGAAAAHTPDDAEVAGSRPTG
jgi:two-component system OmpR family sensor kinase